MSADAIVVWIIFLGNAAFWLILGLKAALAALLRQPRSLSWGRGRWRLVAWYHVRLSPGTQSFLAVGLIVALIAGGWYGVAYHQDLVLLAVVIALAIAIPSIWVLGVVSALRGMRRAWRDGERHRWPERWSERPHDEVTGLVPRPPAALAGPTPSSPPAARRGGPPT
jgi:hypothetical protein